MAEIVHDAVALKHETLVSSPARNSRRGPDAATDPPARAAPRPPAPQTTFRLRAVVCGDAASGKSALVRLACSHGREHPKSYVCSTAPEWLALAQRVPAAALPPRAPPALVDLLLLDTPGGAAFNQRDDAAARLWGSCGAAVVVFDLGSRESFKNVDRWLQKAQVAFAGAASAAAASGGSGGGAAGAGPMLVVLVGAKADFREPGVERAEVSAEEGRACAARLGALEYVEVSAERGLDVERPFAALAAAFARRCLEEREDEDEGAESGVGGSRERR